MHFKMLSANYLLRYWWGSARKINSIANALELRLSYTNLSILSRSQSVKNIDHKAYYVM